MFNSLVLNFLFPSRYYGWNKTTQNNMSLAHFPGWSEEAVEFLATKRDIVGIAVDTIELDPGIELSTFKASLICGCVCASSHSLTLNIRHTWQHAGTNSAYLEGA